MGIALEPGAVVAGHYRLERQIGEGGMGVIWAATQIATDQPVAMKFIRGAASSLERARLIREARATCAIKSPSVVRIFDVIELDDGVPVLVMELLEGEPLGRRLTRDRHIALPELCAILRGVIAPLRSAHALGIVHRDLKPDNLFLVPCLEGVLVKLLDFGIAKIRRSTMQGAAPLTSTNAVLGTLDYMSPEQTFGEKDIDGCSDVWSLGVILYECLSGRSPTRRENSGQTLKAITSGLIAPLSRFAPDVPRELAHLVDQMLTVDPSRRPDLDTIDAVLARYTSADTRVLDAGAAPAPPGRQPCIARSSSAPPVALGRAPLPTFSSPSPPGAAAIPSSARAGKVVTGVLLSAALSASLATSWRAGSPRPDNPVAPSASLLPADVAPVPPRVEVAPLAALCPLQASPEPAPTPLPGPSASAGDKPPPTAARPRGPRPPGAPGSRPSAPGKTQTPDASGEFMLLPLPSALRSYEHE